MNWFGFVNLLGGLALFLYGMQMMSQGLENVAGDKMKKILERMTANRFVGVLTGAVITAVIQSSSATTVMVVGFVNSGLMTLEQAVWIIMGANIGTTITGQMIALDVGKIAPLIAFVGVAVTLISKKHKIQHTGSILGGLGILFIGMNLMGDALVPLKDSKAFLKLMTNFANPLSGILAGTVFTAIIQSSSASVGVLQVLASKGAIAFSDAVYVLFGQNIGTCITALIASIGTNRNAKRTTIIHLMFNVIGTVLFTGLCLLTPLITIVAATAKSNPAGQIANMHTLFNIVTTLVLLPVGAYLPKIVKKLLPDKATQMKPEKDIGLKANLNKHLEHQKLGSSTILLERASAEVYRMLQLARENVELGFDAFLSADITQREKILQNEEELDRMNLSIANYISYAMVNEMEEEVSLKFNSFYTIVGNLERIGDHAVNISDYSEKLYREQNSFGIQEHQEIMNMKELSEIMFAKLLERTYIRDEELRQAQEIEAQFDATEKLYRKMMMARLNSGECRGETGILYSEMLTDYERIGDCLLNIYEEFNEIDAL